MATCNPNECDICNEEFNEGKNCPRILQCFHYFCSECIGKMIATNNKNCPLCRQSFTATSEKEVMVNNAVLDFMKYLTLKDNTKTENKEKSDISGTNIIDDFKSETAKTSNAVLVTCLDARIQTEDLMNSTKEIQEAYVKQIRNLEEIVLPAISRILADRARKVEKFEKSKAKLKKCRQSLEDKRSQLQIVIASLENSRSYKDTAHAIGKADETSTSVSLTLAGSKKFLSTYEETIQVEKQDMESSEERINTIMDILDSFSADKRGAPTNVQLKAVNTHGDIS